MTVLADDVVSFGCRLNIAESEAIRAALAHSPADRRRVVINGCAVTSEAMRQARGAARRARREDADAEVIVTGCAGQVDAAMFAAMPEVTRVIGNAEKLSPGSYAADQPRIAVGSLTKLARTAPQLVGSFGSHARAFLEVQNGCDHACTFCIIPQGRGRARSVPIARVIAAAEKQLAAGHREIVLTGVDVTSWGQDLPGAPRLGDLCAALLDTLPSLGRLRLGSLDVAEIDPLLFELLSGEARMLPHVHLSLQHGHDLILKRMKRRHSRAQAVELVGRLKAARPEIAIGADLIAGFPTEDDDAAAANLSLLDDCDIMFAHIFPYSPRPGTPAARMPQVPAAVAKTRAAALREAAEVRRRRWLSGLLGTIQQMLVERDGVTGHAENFAFVRLSEPTAPGSVVAARVIGLDERGLIAKATAQPAPRS
jgi:threonylcarbamoyladenosine tRNA methylthiotransferase MtaB